MPAKHNKKPRILPERKAPLLNLARDVKGMSLAHAYKHIKSAGANIRVTQLNGMTMHVPKKNEPADDTINVVVMDGIVTQSWV